MGRLADNLKKSLSPIQRIHLAAFLLPMGGDVQMLSGLEVSQRNAVLVLIVANDLDVLREFFRETL
jgi:hypothetical protein